MRGVSFFRFPRLGLRWLLSLEQNGGALVPPPCAWLISPVFHLFAVWSRGIEGSLHVSLDNYLAIVSSLSTLPRVRDSGVL